MRTFEHATICPFCGVQHDETSTVYEGPGSRPAGPADGDFTMCIRCGEWAVFDLKAPGRLRKPNEDEYTTIGTNKKFQRARLAWTKIRIDRRKAAIKEINADITTPLADEFQKALDAVSDAPPGEGLASSYRVFFFMGCLAVWMRIIGLKGKSPDAVKHDSAALQEQLMRYFKREFSADIERA